MGMFFTNFFKKFKEDFALRKKIIVTAVIVVLVLFGITLIKVNGTSLLASVMIRPNMNINVIKCTDSDGGRNFYVKGTTQGPSINNNQIIQQTDQCSNASLTEYFCNPEKKLESVTFTCINGCSNGACIANEYGYGYGYNSGNTYGYGYGYKMLDKNGNYWMYLVVSFETYSKAIYDTVMSKFGFKMVKYFNNKEFIDPTAKNLNVVAPAIKK